MKLLEKIVSGAKKSAKKAGLVGALVASSLVSDGCGGGNHKNSEHYLTPQEIALTERLADTQLDNGGWNQSQLLSDPIDYSAQGTQMVTGTAALGLFDAHQVDLYDGDDKNTNFVPDTLEQTKDFLYGKMEDLNNNLTAMINPSNFLFMKKYDEKFGLSQEEKDSTQDAWDRLLWRWDMMYGSDPTVQVDGLYNRIYGAFYMQGREAVAGIYNSYLLRSAIAMNEPSNEIGWLLNKLRNSPTDPEIEGGISSMAHILYTLNEAGDTSMNASLIQSMNSKRNSNGSYGPTPENNVQETAYALMALKEIGSSDATDTHRWLKSQIRNGGLIYDPATETEKPEVSGNVLHSLLMDRKP